MTFTPPDFSEILSKEQIMNSRLTILQNNLRTRLTNAGISYSQTDTINQLIDKYEILPIFKTEDNENPLTAEKLGRVYQLANVNDVRWQVSEANNNA